MTAVDLAAPDLEWRAGDSVVSQPFPTIQVPDQDLNRVQANISNSFNSILGASSLLVAYDTNGRQSVLNSTVSCPFLGGNLISTPISAGKDNLVPHGLNKIPSVWVLCGQDTNATVWSQNTSSLSIGPDPKNASAVFINIWASSSCNIKLWVN